MKVEIIFTIYTPDGKYCRVNGEKGCEFLKVSVPIRLYSGCYSCKLFKSKSTGHPTILREDPVTGNVSRCRACLKAEKK